MLRRNEINDISDDDFVSEKQICQGTSKTVLSVESVHVVKGIDKNIKKKIEEGKIYLNDISAVKNAEIEEAFLRSLHCNHVENYSEEHLRKMKTESSMVEKLKVESSNKKNYEEDKAVSCKDGDDETNVTRANSGGMKREVNKKDNISEKEEMECSSIKCDTYTANSGSSVMLTSSNSSICYNHDIQKIKTILKKRTIEYIKKTKVKMEKKRLNANLEALRLQYIPINSDKFASVPREIKENILALFSCIIVKHIDSFDDEEVQNHLDDISKKFLRQLADMLAIDSLAYQSIIKPFEQRKRIREMTGDKTFYELYEKPFIDNLLLRINELQPDIDAKFKRVVEELNNEMDFWQNDELESVPEREDAKEDMENNSIKEEVKDSKTSADSDRMSETKLSHTKEKEKNFNNTKSECDDSTNKDNSNQVDPVKKKEINTKVNLEMEISDYFTIEGKRLNTDSSCVKQKNENSSYVDEELNSVTTTHFDSNVNVCEDKVNLNLENLKGNLENGVENCELSETVESEIKKQKIKETNAIRTDSNITISSKSEVEQDLYHEKKIGDSSSNEDQYESDIEKQLNHGVPTKSPEAKSVLLRDLITTYIMTGNNNARIQLYFQKFAKCLKINELLILRIEENLAADLINALQASINESSKRKKIRRIKIAFAALGGGALIAFTAGLAAPGIATGLATLGAGSSSLTAFLASASFAFIVSLFGAGGAGLTGYKYSRRIANIKTFEFIMLNGSVSKSLSVCVCISGEIKTDDDITRPWLEVFPNCYCDLYCLKWENHLLQTLGSLIETMLSQEFAVTAGRIWLQHALGSTLGFSLTWPLALIKYASNLDNAYLLIRERAQQAGRILAEALSDKNTVGQRPVILIGYSMGARVIFYCLKYLHSKKLYNIVSNAIFIGLPATTSTKVWNKIRMVVTNRVINVYSKNDWLLGFLYRYMEWKISVAGLMPIKAAHVENFDVSGIITSHLDYKTKLKDIFNLINFDM